VNVRFAHLSWDDTPFTASTSHAMRNAMHHHGDESLEVWLDSWTRPLIERICKSAFDVFLACPFDRGETDAEHRHNVCIVVVTIAAGAGQTGQPLC
jgi:hypothetical protein